MIFTQVWTGSEYFKTAEKDMKKYCASASDKYSCALNDTPSGSPARWFYWGDYGWGADTGMTMPAAAIGATATSMVNNQKYTLKDTYEVTLKPYSYEFLADIWPGK